MSHDRLPDHDLPDHVLRWLEATERRIARELEPRLGAAERSLWPRRLRVLQLVPTAGIRQSELARRALVTKQALGALVDTLETDGFLERSPDPDDRRASRLAVTPDGRAALERTTAARNALFASATAGWTDSEVDELVLLLNRLSHDLENQ